MAQRRRNRAVGPEDEGMTECGNWGADEQPVAVVKRDKGVRTKQGGGGKQKNGE
jgi:hypothetical protein